MASIGARDNQAVSVGTGWYVCLSSAQMPVQSWPSAHVNVPNPVRLLSAHSPEYLFPSAQV
eukprot:m.770836 g.770836  ORF g.770836 m.770836 type:complete len:61 (+) comp59086_c0_seq3:1927-2109(+)